MPSEIHHPEGDVAGAEEARRLDHRHADVVPAWVEHVAAVLGRVQPVRDGVADGAERRLAPGEVLADEAAAEVAGSDEQAHEGLAAGTMRELVATADRRCSQCGRAAQTPRGP